MKWVYDFTEGEKSMSDLLGGKGANLAEMTKLGLPVPPGFTITTEACNHFLQTGDEPRGLMLQIATAMAATESRANRRFGDPHDPLLVAVRSGAKFSMPGMMETVLNIGLNDITVQGLAEVTSNLRFALDSYRRLIQMFAKTVMGLDPVKFEHAFEAVKHAAGVEFDYQLNEKQLSNLIADYKSIFKEVSGEVFPQDVHKQLQMAVLAVFHSWNTDRAKLYRRQEQIPENLGTAVNVMAMVFGNRGQTSGTGVAFTRDPATGTKGAYGDWLVNAQGEDVVAGIRNTLKLDDMNASVPEAHDELMNVMNILETHYRDLCDIEFTVEEGKLWMLQTRIGKRTAAAAFRIAVQLVEEGLISNTEALMRVSGAQLMQLMFPKFDDGASKELIATGIAASPGAAVGKLVFSAERAVEVAATGEAVILARRETNPDDLAGMVASVGILTSRGGKTSHAAVVARGMGKTAVCGADDIVIDLANKTLTTPSGLVLNELDVISIDGTTGHVYNGAVPVSASRITQYFNDELSSAEIESDPLIRAVDHIIFHADSVRKLRVRANADNGEDAARARRMGAEGVGLARTEHMFLGERRELVERLILSETESERQSSLDALLPFQIKDFKEILDEMDGLPVIIRLIDPPLHEFLPDFTELSIKVALQERDGSPNPQDVKLLAALNRMHEANPMLGLRGVRLGIMFPGLFALQISAIVAATIELIKQGKSPHPEIMVPLVSTVAEFDPVRKEAEDIIKRESVKAGVDLHIPIGTMIEVPRAALTAERIAQSADFFSFGTNDLTQTTWGFSRDDVEAAFFSEYLERGIFGTSPFESIDPFGVGELVRMATQKGRSVKADLPIGICGEHGGDPRSIHFFHDVGLDYVSASPYRVPVARLEAARAALGQGTISTTA